MRMDDVDGPPALPALVSRATAISGGAGKLGTVARGPIAGARGSHPPGKRASVSLLRRLVIGLSLVASVFLTDVCYAVTPAHHPRSIFHFDLTDQKNNEIDESKFRGKFALVYFGYTYCPDVCPTDLQVMATALDLLGDMGSRVEPVFVTLDPERDTPQQLADYLPMFHPRLVGLTGSIDAISDLARAFGVKFRRYVELSERAPLIDHSSYTYLVGPDGRYLTRFLYATEPHAMAAEIKQYIGTYRGAGL